MMSEFLSRNFKNFSQDLLNNINILVVFNFGVVISNVNAYNIQNIDINNIFNSLEINPLLVTTFESFKNLSRTLSGVNNIVNSMVNVGNMNNMNNMSNMNYGFNNVE